MKSLRLAKSAIDAAGRSAADHAAVRGSEERWDEPGQQPGYQQSEPSENPTVQEYDAR